MTGNAVTDTILLIAAIAIAAQAILVAFDKISTAYQWIKEMHHQLSPDDGESVKDVIERVDENDAIHHRNIEKVYAVVLKMHDIDPMEAPLLERQVTKDTQRDRRRVSRDVLP